MINTSVILKCHIFVVHVIKLYGYLIKISKDITVNVPHDFYLALHFDIDIQLILVQNVIMIKLNPSIVHLNFYLFD